MLVQWASGSVDVIKAWLAPYASVDLIIVGSGNGVFPIW